MTYKELMEFLKKLSDEQLDMNVTVRVNGEYHACQYIFLMKETDEDADVLDVGHPVIELI